MIQKDVMVPMFPCHLTHEPHSFQFLVSAAESINSMESGSNELTKRQILWIATHVLCR